MSKSGLFAHFGSKEELQLATVEKARLIFIEQVTRPALTARKGMPRLWKIIDLWLALVERNVFKEDVFSARRRLNLTAGAGWYATASPRSCTNGLG
jgi:AcrR family transcriptional regulator